MPKLLSRDVRCGLFHVVHLLLELAALGVAMRARSEKRFPFKFDILAPP